MKAAEIFEQMGIKLSDHYANAGFKYSKKWGVKKSTKEYEYIISFHSTEGNTKNRIALFVNFQINCRTVKNSWGNSEQLIFISLWDLGYRYEIGESHTLEQACEDIIKHAEILLIPFIDIFENQANNSLQEWITEGFLGEIPAGLYHFPHLDYTTHKHYWIGTEFSKNHQQFGFTISLRYIFEKFGRENAEKCLNNYYQSLNEESKNNFAKAYQCEMTDTVWSLDYQHYPDVEKVKYAVKQGLKLL
jgi:hypothetical protein